MEAPREFGITRHRISTPLSFCRNDGLVLGPLFLKSTYSLSVKGEDYETTSCN
jgi:hypothetical protein